MEQTEDDSDGLDEAGTSPNVNRPHENRVMPPNTPPANEGLVPPPAPVLPPLTPSSNVAETENPVAEGTGGEVPIETGAGEYIFIYFIHILFP